MERDRPTGVVRDVPELERGPGSFIGLAIGTEQNEVLKRKTLPREKDLHINSRTIGGITVAHHHTEIRTAVSWEN